MLSDEKLMEMSKEDLIKYIHQLRGHMSRSHKIIANQNNHYGMKLSYIKRKAKRIKVICDYIIEHPYSMHETRR